MSQESGKSAEQGSAKPTFGDRVANGAAFALGAAAVAGVVGFVASGGNPAVAIAAATKVGSLAGVAGTTGGC